MNRIKVFLSSRVNSDFSGLDQSYSMKDLRAFISDSLESASFLGEKIIEVVKNEDNFNADLSRNAFDNCMQTLRICNIIIILYNGEAGWAITDYSTNGICHEEFLLAVNEFGTMSYMIDLSHFFRNSVDAKAKARNDQFRQDITSYFRHKENIQATTVKELTAKVEKQIKKYVLNALQKSFATQKKQAAAYSVYGQTLDWSKLNYEKREEALLNVLEAAIRDLPLLDNVTKSAHAIPDKMSVADARNRIGRPFMHDYEILSKEKKEQGVIHFIAVYGNATETQAKDLVGYPDLTVIKTPFGFYLWEHIVHIQIFFLVKCVNGPTIGTRISELINWLNSSKESSKIVPRAQGRLLILKAMKQSQELKNL